MLTEPGGVTGIALIPFCSLFLPIKVFADKMAVVPRMVVLKKFRRERSVELFFLTQRAPRLCKGRKASGIVYKAFAFFAFSLRSLREPFASRLYLYPIPSSGQALKQS